MKSGVWKPDGRRTAARIVCAVLTILGSLASSTAFGERELHVTPKLERAVTRGLEYLARTQKADGSWPGNNGRVSGVVGIALLAFLAHGEMPYDSKYGDVMQKCIDYIIKNQQANGLLSTRGRAMYSHGFATLALAEVYGMTRDPRVGSALRRAVGLIVSSQNQLGGWRYSVNSNDADTTVSGAQMMALRAAASAGIEVPVETIQRGVAYYKSVFCHGGGFGYTRPSGPNAPRSGIGLLILSLSGEYNCPEAKATADWLFSHGHWQQHYFYYGCYYCSQAMYQAGGRYWQHWNETMTPTLIAKQLPDGSWPGGAGGTVCSTAMALLAMEINYNFLPIYQR